MEHVEGRSCGHVHVSTYHASENFVHAKQLLKQFFEFLERIAELACMVRTCPHPKPVSHALSIVELSSQPVALKLLSSFLGAPLRGRCARRLRNSYLQSRLPMSVDFGKAQTQVVGRGR